MSIKIVLNQTKDMEYISDVPHSVERGMFILSLSFPSNFFFFLVRIKFEIYLGILNKSEHFKKLGTSAAFFLQHLRGSLFS